MRASVSLSTFDEFLANPEQRDLTRALLALTNASRGLFLAHGHAPAAAKLVELLATHFPDDRVHLLMAQRNPTRAVTVLGAGEVQSREAPDTSVAQLVRAFLRQDPDVIAITQLDAEVGPVALQAAFTGHQVLLGSAASDVEAVLAALVGAEEHLRDAALGTVGAVAELDLDGKLTRVRRAVQGELHDVARVEEDGSTRLIREHLPQTQEPSGPTHTPRWAPRVDQRPPPTGETRRAFLVRTGGEGPHLLGTRHASRPPGSEWPTCRECRQPLHLVVQLDLAPVLQRDQLAQLFLCGKGGCELRDESAAGVRCELLSREGLVTLHAPESLPSSGVLDPGAIGELVPFDDDRSAPLRCDKIFGWPSFEQGEDWPADTRLLFQFAEGSTLEGGTAPGWSFDDARQLPGTPPKKVLDPNEPRHFPALITGEAVAFLFLGRDGLAFRWQTG